MPDIMRELGFSRRQFFREQTKAVAMLAAALWSKLPREAAPPEEPDDLLAAEAGRVLAQREPLDVFEVLEGVLDVVSPLARKHDVALEHRVSPELRVIRGNRTLLRQILVSALSSIITRRHHGRIILRLLREGQVMVVELTGQEGRQPPRPEGAEMIAPPEMDRLRRLVEMVGGRWEVCEFTPTACACRFSLPVESQDVLLVVEDNEAVIHAFRRQLVGHHYRVVGATNGAEALQLAREIGPSAITLDVMMPALDGWEILQTLKSDPATRHIPVVVCSVLVDPELAYSLGAEAYLQKPVTQADLLSVLNSITGSP